MPNELNETVTIPLSRKKLILGVVGSAAFIAISAWLWSIAETQQRHSPLSVKVVAASGLTIFGVFGAYCCIKLFDRKSGLIIDSMGLIDNSSAIAAGRIEWHEITGIRETAIMGQRFLTIDVVDAEKFLGRGNSYVRMLNAANARATGSPINISANALQVTFDDLLARLMAAYRRYGEELRHGDQVG